MPKDEEMIAKLKSAFDAIAGESGYIEAEDLRNILNRVFENKGKSHQCLLFLYQLLYNR